MPLSGEAGPQTAAQGALTCRASLERSRNQYVPLAFLRLEVDRGLHIAFSDDLITASRS